MATERHEGSSQMVEQLRLVSTLGVGTNQLDKVVQGDSGPPEALL